MALRGGHAGRPPCDPRPMSYLLPHGQYRRVGKDALAKAAAVIGTGCEPPSESYLLSGRRRDRSEDIEELRKLGTTAAIEGHVAFLLDNVPTGWGSAHPSSTLSQPRPSTVGANSGRTKPRPVRHLPSGFSQGTISAPLATPSGGRSPSGYTSCRRATGRAASTRVRR